MSRQDRLPGRTGQGRRQQRGLVMGRRVRTAGNLTLNNTAWTDLNPGWDGAAAQDISLPAAAGDWIEASIDVVYDSAAVNAYLNIVAQTSGNGFTTTAGTGAGIPGLTGFASVSGAQASTFHYQVVAGDIAGGLIALRIRYRTSAAVAKTLAAISDQQFTFAAKNLGYRLSSG